MEINKKLLKDYLTERSLLVDDDYIIEEISSCRIMDNVMGEKAININMQFSLNHGKEIYSDNVSVRYNSYMNFLLKIRKQKVDKIINKL